MPATGDETRILFTAFEMSGDALAAAVIRRLGIDRPNYLTYGFGGPKMKAAGCSLIENTTGHAVMLASAVKKVFEHRRRLKHLESWLKCNRIDCLVAVDSPAANWSICQLIKRMQPHAKVVHLAAPQLWAWAPWRIKKLKRLTDHVLCLLPFEPAWFGAGGVPATFVGHPVYEQVAHARPHPELPDGPMKVALLPGSRREEIKRNWPNMAEAYLRLLHKHPHLVACIAAADREISDCIQSVWDREFGAYRWPRSMHTVTSQADEVLAWADVVLVVSGTATLQVAAHHKPMVIVYELNRWTWNLVGRWAIQTRTFSLPNLIAQAAASPNGTLRTGKEGRVVPEFVPNFGATDPIFEAMDALVSSEEAREAQRQALAQVNAAFAGVAYSHKATGALLQVIEGKV